MKTIISELDFLKKIVIIQWNIRKKDLQLFATKWTEKIPAPRNVKEHSITYKKKTHKISKIIKNNYLSKIFESPSIVDIKSVITKHRKTLHKVSETIRQAEKVGSNSSLYSDTKKWKFFKQKKLKK